LINVIASKPTYYGKPVSPAIIKQMQIEIRPNGAGIIAPFWISVLQYGRPPRQSSTDSQLWKRMFAWMDKNNLFKSATERGRINEAKRMTWYLNKYGNKHFRSKQFIDVYESARKQTIANVEKAYTEFAFKITSDIL
jgi:hypothetical protein